MRDVPKRRRCPGGELIREHAVAAAVSRARRPSLLEGEVMGGGGGRVARVNNQQRACEGGGEGMALLGAGYAGRHSSAGGGRDSVL